MLDQVGKGRGYTTLSRGPLSFKCSLHLDVPGKMPATGPPLCQRMIRRLMVIFFDVTVGEKSKWFGTSKIMRSPNFKRNVMKEQG